MISPWSGSPRSSDPAYFPSLNAKQVKKYGYAAGRPVTVTTPDGAVVETSYSLATSGGQIGTVVTVEDQAGKLRRSITNALGQLVRVDEPNSSNQLGAVASPTQPTHYSYDPLGKLVHVEQGAQHRWFMYDSLGRMIRVRQPEQTLNPNLATAGNPGNNSWTAAFTYDPNGNVQAATDAKGTTITSTYDAHNRVLTRSYSDNVTPTVTFTYDDPNIASSKGKLTKVASSVSESRYTQFDLLGRLKQFQQHTDGRTYTTSYEYNLSGALIKETYPSGREVRNELDPSGDISRIFGKATQTASERTYANAFTYFADGRIEKLRLGNGLWESAKINSRGQVTEFSLGHGVSSGDVWKNTYEYGELSGGTVDATKNSGNIAKQTITFDGLANPLVQTYQYDSLYRLTEAKETSNGSSQVWKQTFECDRYGNRTAYDKWLGTTAQTLSAVEEPTIDNTNNRLSSGQGYTFDAKGNMIVDAVGRQFTFNGDNKQTEVKDASNNIIGRYWFDGEGKRIKKETASETTVFVYSAGKLIAEYSTGTPPQNPTTSWTVTDQLGSPRVIVNGLAEVVSRRDFMPFGEELEADGTYRITAQKYGQTDSVRQKFTGYQKDEETGLDFAEARMYQNLHGRFTAVDPLLASGKSANPQTFNRYVYVGNRPLTVTDPTGLDWYWMNDPDKKGRIMYRWYGENPGGGWSAVDFGGASNLYFQVPNADEDGTPLGTVYIHRYSNSRLNQEEYSNFLNRPAYLGCAGLTNVCVGNPAAVFDRMRGWQTGGWNFLAATVNSPVEFPIFHTAGGSFSARQAFGLPLILEYAEYQNRAEAESAFQVQVGLTAASFATGGVTSAARTSRFAGAVPQAINGASLDFLTQGQIARIQAFANKRNVEVTLFGSRARGTANSLSDWDYLIDANYKIRKEAKWVLPKGPANSGRNRIDVIKPSNFPFDISNQPQIIFRSTGN